MIALRIEEIKEFTSGLFLGTIFDCFLLREATVITFNTFSIDGHIKQGYYSERELEENQIEDLSAWAVIKPICFSLLKGKKLPGSFQITLQLCPADMEEFLLRSQVGLAAEQIGGLYINIRYEEGSLYCVTGTSLKVFTLDKAIEIEWDEYIRIFLRQQGFTFKENC